jgi:hypothetical protein
VHTSFLARPVKVEFIAVANLKKEERRGGRESIFGKI